MRGWTSTTPRRGDAPRTPLLHADPVANLPWNAGWDGQCEHCGRVFGFSHRCEYSSGCPPVGRSVRAEPVNTGYRIFLDGGIAVAAIRIAVTHGSSDVGARHESAVLTLDELRAMVAAFEGQSAVLDARWDWEEDWT